MISTSATAQTDPNNQVIVYFRTGVTRVAPGDTTANITSTNVLNILSAYSIPTSNVVPSFPSFVESDTVQIDIGEDSRQMNLAKIFTITLTLTDSSHKANLIADISDIPEVLYAESNGTAIGDITPNDTKYSLQYGLKNNGSTQTTLSRNFDGTITLKATVSNLCGSQQVVINKTVLSGSTPPSGFYFSNGVSHNLVDEISGSNFVSPNTWIVVHSSTSLSPYGTWTSEGGFDYSWQVDAFHELNVNVQSDGYAALQLDITGECGPITKTYIFEPDESFSSFSVSPNPATSTVSVSMNNTKLSRQSAKVTSDQSIRQVILLDKFGNAILKRNYPVNTRNITLDVGTLHFDVYVMRIFDGKKWHSVKLMKN